MSILGTQGVGGYSVAGAFAGAINHSADGDQVQAARAAKKTRSDEVQLSQRALDDSAETEQSHGQVADRDADGRLPWQLRRRPSEADEAPGSDGATASDSDFPNTGETGGLDLSA